MQVTVFGATGGIGRIVVELLAADGHAVVAYVRPSSALAADHPRVTVVEGELTDAPAIARAVGGSDAVISALGPSLRRGSTGTPVADGTRAIVAAMHAAGVRRYVGLATPSVADPRDRAHWKAKVFPALARVMFPNALVELRAMTTAVTGSGLDWTLARITSPTDGAARRTVRAGFLGRDRIGSRMTRADIAAFRSRSSPTPPTCRQLQRSATERGAGPGRAAAVGGPTQSRLGSPWVALAWSSRQ